MDREKDIPLFLDRLSINMLFIKLNSRLISKNIEKFNQCCDDLQKENLLKTLWFEEYDVKLELDGIDSKMSFRSEDEKTMFLLKNSH